MPRYIAIYKGYDNAIGLEQGKDYCIISQKEDNNQIKVTITKPKDVPMGILSYASEWEFLKDWQILRSWMGKK